MSTSRLNWPKAAWGLLAVSILAVLLPALYRANQSTVRSESVAKDGTRPAVAPPLLSPVDVTKPADGNVASRSATAAATPAEGVAASLTTHSVDTPQERWGGATEKPYFWDNYESLRSEEMSRHDSAYVQDTIRILAEKRRDRLAAEQAAVPSLP